MNIYLYDRCPVCLRTVPLLVKKNNKGEAVPMLFELKGFDLRRLTSDTIEVQRACRKCVMNPGWHYE